MTRTHRLRAAVDLLASGDGWWSDTDLRQRRRVLLDIAAALEIERPPRSFERCEFLDMPRLFTTIIAAQIHHEQCGSGGRQGPAWEWAHGVLQEIDDVTYDRICSALSIPPPDGTFDVQLSYVPVALSWQ